MARTISGYAARFNEPTTIGGLFRERIAPGAFDKSLRERPDVLALWSHDVGRVLGRTASGTLELRADRVGLWFALEPDESTPDGLTALGTVTRQDVATCSFGFMVTRETWDEGGDNELPLRTIEEAILVEISLVALAAYPTTSAAILNGNRAAHNRNNASLRRAEAAMRKRGMI